MENRINLIGIAGRKGSGKNTVAYIIQHQIARANGISTLSHPLKEDETMLAAKSNWQQKSFASTLKQIASILLGIPVVDFENEEVKNKLLPDDWKVTKEVDGVKTEELLTVRGVLQRLGTEIGRNIHPDIWIKSLFANREQRVKIPNDDTEEYITYLPNWIITDVRFPNEADAIKDRGGLLLRVFRPGKLRVWYNDSDNSDEEDCSGYYYVQDIEGDIWLLNEYSNPTEMCMGTEIQAYKHELEFDPLDNHPSETALDDYLFDYIIINDGDIESLNKKVKEVLIKFDII